MSELNKLVAQMAKCQEQLQILLSASSQSTSSTSAESSVSSSEPSSSSLSAGAVSSPISQSSLSSVSSSEPSPSSTRSPSLTPTPQAQSSLNRSESSQTSPAQDANPMVNVIKSEPNCDRDIIWVAPPGHAPKPLMTETEKVEKQLAEVRERAKLAKMREEIAKLELETEESKKKTREHEKKQLEVQAENEKAAAEHTVEAATAPQSQENMDRINDLQRSNRQPSVPVLQVILPPVEAPIPPKQEPHPKDQSDHRPQANQLQVAPPPPQHPHFQVLQEELIDQQQVVKDEREESEGPSVTPSETSKSRKRPLPINDLQRPNRQPSVPVSQVILPPVEAPVPPKQEPHPKDQSDHRPQADQSQIAPPPPQNLRHTESYKKYRNQHDLHLPADERGKRRNEERMPAVDPMLQPEMVQSGENQLEPDQLDNHQPETEQEEDLEDKPGSAPRASEYMGFVNDIGRPEVRDYGEMFSTGAVGMVAREPMNFEELDEEVVMEDVEVNPLAASLQELEEPMVQDPLDLIRDHEIRTGNRIARGGAAVRTQFGILRRGFRNRDGTAFRPGRGRGGRGTRGGNGLASSIEAQEAVSSGVRGARGGPRASRVPRATRGRRGARASTHIRAKGADNAPMLQEELIDQVVEEQGEESEGSSVTPSDTSKTRKRPLPKTNDAENEEAKKKKKNAQKNADDRASRAAARNESKGDNVRNIQYVRRR